MLEEVGEPYETEILDYASTHEGRALSVDQSDGKVPAIATRARS
jgi:predicted RNA-binding protein with TRAM domain